MAMTAAVAAQDWSRDCKSSMQVSAWDRDERSSVPGCKDRDEMSSVQGPGDRYERPSEKQDKKNKVVKVLKYRELKKSNKVFESEVYSTKGYCYQLIVRPNGLRYTKGFNKCIGVWLKPVQGEEDKHLDWPARVRLGLTIGGAEVQMQDYTWTRKDTKSINPVLNFDLEVFEHSKIEKKYEDQEECGVSIHIND
jgi:hypothetical protein